MTTKTPTLLIMAAGMGNRYGGLKQIDPVGPGGATIMDYSVFDAMRAGFGKLAFVIRRDIEAAFRDVVGARFESRLPVEYVFQELDNLPQPFAVPAGRTKPWGTGHAILSAADAIDGPFAAINADDFYGARAFALLAEHFRSGSDDHAMVAYQLTRTLSDHGSVTRALCVVGRDGFLSDITEVENIRRDGNGATYVDGDRAIHRLSAETTVSMSMWGFMPTLFAQLSELWVEFLDRDGHRTDSEFYIPSAVGSLVTRSRARCRVLTTTDSWFGVTHAADRPAVVDNLQRLVEQGQYPARLWS